MKRLELERNDAAQQRARWRRGVAWLAMTSGVALGMLTAALGTAPDDDARRPMRGSFDAVPAEPAKRTARAAALDDGVDWQHVPRHAADPGRSVAAYGAAGAP